MTRYTHTTFEQIKTRFMDKVYPEPNTGCWLWAGAHHPRYGHGSLNGSSYYGFNWAHRFSYFIHNGDFDRSLCVLHKCDIPTCVNPDHLFIGTALENQIDKVNKGRQQRGEKHAFAKINEQDVRNIREAHKSGESMVSIGKRYGLHNVSIFDIVHRINWKHVL